MRSFSRGSSSPGTEPRSCELQIDSLPSELPRKPQNERLLYFKCFLFYFLFGCILLVAGHRLFAAGCRLLSLWYLGSKVVLAHMGSLFLDQGSNLCPLFWKADSQPWTTREVPRGYYLYSAWIEYGSWQGILPQQVVVPLCLVSLATSCQGRNYFSSNSVHSPQWCLLEQWRAALLPSLWKCS